MDLASLLVELKPLIAEPEAHWGRIVELMEEHSGLAESEVARHWVAERLAPTLVGLSRSRDPRERLRAVDAARWALPARELAGVLWRLAKDPFPRVRIRAVNLTRAAGLSDVALPDRAGRGGRNVGGGKGQLGWFLLDADKVRALRRGRTSPVKPDLPKVKTPADLATLLGCASEKDFPKLLRVGEGPGSPYVRFTVPKARGGERVITAPKAALKRVQRAVLDKILAKLPAHPSAHGFLPERSVVTNATPHLGSALVVKLDLEDFFPTVHYRRVEGFFRLYYPAPVARVLAGLTTHRTRLPDGYVVYPGELPQGAPTSPALANLLCRRMDSRLAGLAAKVGARYTRYADDLTFSFPTEPKGPLGRFFWWVDQVLQQEGFAENAGKRRVLRPHQRQLVTGVVVNQAPHLPREARRRFRAILHNCRKHGVDAQARGREDFRDYLRGFAAWAAMVDPVEGRRLQEEVRALLGAEVTP